MKINTSVNSSRLKVWLPLMLLTWVLPSCLNEDVCEDVASVPARIGFSMINPKDGEPQTIAMDSLTVFGLGNDSILYNKTNNVSRIELPLIPGADSCAFVIAHTYDSILPPLADTLWFFYQTKPNLISMDCGFVTFFELEKVTYSRNFIDTLTIEFSSIINNLDEHIKIFPFIANDNP